MSDFLGRLTARHAEGSASPIVPRAVSRFEAPSLPVEQNAVAPVAAGHVTQTTPAPVVASPVSVARSNSRESQSTIERVVRDEKPEIAPVERAMPVKARVEQILEAVETIVRTEHARVEPRTERAPGQSVVATPAVPRIVPTVEPREPVRGNVSPTRTERDAEPTVIRVHIGRIEVRGAPQAPERPRPRVAKTAELSKPMSLERYLGGKERA
jgi:hypothetical protein